MSGAVRISTSPSSTLGGLMIAATLRLSVSHSIPGASTTDYGGKRKA